MSVRSLPQTMGVVYGVIALLLIIYLWKSGRMTRRTGFVFLLLSTLFGFLVFAPVAPYQFQSLFVRNLSAPGAPVMTIAFGLLFFVVMTFLFGRIFCGYICPVGALQELTSLIPVEKRLKSVKKYSVPIRAGFLVMMVVLAVFFQVRLLAFFGIRDFFYLNTGSVFFYVFLAVLILSVVVYRPFCRFICPFGVLLSLAAAIGVYKLRRTDDCVRCSLCEQACPADEMREEGSRSECYLCGRCVEQCKKGALVYSGKK